MARPKKNPDEKVEVVESTLPPEKPVEQKQEVKVKEDPNFREAKSRNEANMYRYFLGGNEYWATERQISIGIARGLKIELPESSPLELSVTRCTTCGK